jgi:hypothetical protein
MKNFLVGMTLLGVSVGIGVLLTSDGWSKAQAETRKAQQQRHQMQALVDERARSARKEVLLNTPQGEVEHLRRSGYYFPGDQPAELAPID